MTGVNLLNYTLINCNSVNGGDRKMRWIPYSPFIDNRKPDELKKFITSGFGFCNAEDVSEKHIINVPATDVNRIVDGYLWKSLQLWNGTDRVLTCWIPLWKLYISTIVERSNRRKVHGYQLGQQNVKIDGTAVGIITDVLDIAITNYEMGGRIDRDRYSENALHHLDSMDDERHIFMQLADDLDSLLEENYYPQKRCGAHDRGRKSWEISSVGILVADVDDEYNATWSVEDKPKDEQDD